MSAESLGVTLLLRCSSFWGVSSSRSLFLVMRFSLAFPHLSGSLSLLVSIDDVSWDVLHLLCSIIAFAEAVQLDYVLCLVSK